MQTETLLWPNLFPPYTTYNLSNAPVKLTTRTRLHSLRVFESGVIPGCYGVGSPRLPERNPTNPSWIGSLLTIPYKRHSVSAHEERLAAQRDISSTWLYSYGAHGTNRHNSSPTLPLDSIPGLYDHLKLSYPSLPHTLNLVEQFHATCSGVKVCPIRSKDYIKSFTHTDVTAQNLANQTECHDKKLAEGLSSPISLTLMYYQMLSLQGCRHRQTEETLMSRDTLKRWDERESHLLQLRRGQKLAEERCHGRLSLFDDSKGTLFVRCEHFHSTTSPSHRFERVSMTLNHGYLRALFNGNQSETFEYEIDCYQKGYGPLSECFRYENASSTTNLCNGIHRGYGTRLTHSEDGDDIHQGPDIFPPFELLHTKCKSAIRVLFPKDRDAFPFALILTRNAHEHPIPTPSTTPEPVNRAMRALIEAMGDDIPGLTPRKLIENPVMISYLRRHCPNEESHLPGLLHPSLYNKDRLQRLIDEVRDKSFPEGMDEAGLRRLAKERPDYIVAVHPDTGDDSYGSDGFIALLMTPWMTSQLQELGRFLMFDTAFKLIAGHYTMFGIVLNIDQPFTKTLTVMRAVTTGESSDIVYKVLQLADRAMHQRTGYGLVFRITRPLNVPGDIPSIDMVTTDLGKGQALGFGRLLREQMHKLSDDDVEGLHHTGVFSRSISPKELTEYEMLSYGQRACQVHGKRNIDQLSAPLELKSLCLSLYEYRRELSFDETEQLMSNAGTRDWYLDKLHSPFALQAMGPKSQIPSEIFHAGHKDTNAIESTHQNILRSGKGVSLVQAVLLCERFDRGEEASVLNRFETGVGARDGKADLMKKMNLNDRRNVTSHEKAIVARAQSTSTSSHTDESALEIPSYHRYVSKMQHSDLTEIITQVQVRQIELGVPRRQMIKKSGKLAVRQSNISKALDDIDLRSSKPPGHFRPMPASFSQAMASSVPSGSSSTLAPESHSTSSHSGYTQAMEDWSWKASTHSIPPSIQPIIAASNTPYFSPSSSLDDGAPYANSPGASLYIPSLPPPVPNPAYTWDEINRQDSCSGSAFSFQYGDWEGALPNFIQATPEHFSGFDAYPSAMSASNLPYGLEEEDPNACFYTQ